MTPNETDAQVDAQNEACTTPTLQEEEASSSSSQEMGGSTPSNVLDQPIKSEQEDLIGFQDLQEGLVTYINNATMPLTIALQGEWGIGKTSFLNLLKIRLCDDNKSLYYSVWIDACEFTLLQSPTVAIINMLQSMVYQIGHLTPNTANEQQGSKYIEIIQNLSKYAAKKLIMNSAKMATANIVDEQTIDEIGNVISDTWSKNNTANNNELNTLSAVKKLHDDIISLIEATFQHNIYNKNNLDKRGIVFFIDNLDRIDPTLAVEILEITKNIFDFDKCVFIIALDYTVVIRGLQSKLGQLTSDNEYIFRTYFDKYVQQTVNLPRLPNALNYFMVKLINNISLFNENELKSNELINGLLFISCTSIGYNPRLIKRFINTLSFILSIKKAQTVSTNTPNATCKGYDGIDTTTKTLLFAIISIQTAFPNIYQALSDHTDIWLETDKNNQSKSNTIDNTDNLIESWKDSLAKLNANNNTFKNNAAIAQSFFIITIMKNMSKSCDNFNQKLREAFELTRFSFVRPIFNNW